MECTIENKKMVALSKVVSASIIDTYSDIGRTEQRNSHWAARGLRKLYAEALPNVKHKVWLPVSSNTHTATLPLDFYEETFVGFVDTRWHKVPIRLNNRLTDSVNIVDVPCESACPKCGQDTNICNDLVVTENVNLIVINDVTYEQTIIKKLYPNGDYYLETTTPVFDVIADDVIYARSKEFIAAFDLKPCGCLDTTPLNTSNLQTHCPDIYCNYFAPCDTTCCTDYGGYKIFEESGLIQMDQRYPFEKVYLEYNGYISKINGQYYVPMVAFETLVEWTKWKEIANKRNMTRWERMDQFESYKRERANMEKVLGRIPLSFITQSINSLPKFDIDYNWYDWYGCFSCSTPAPTSITTSSTSVNPATGECCVTNVTTIVNRTGFVLNVKVDGNTGSPVAGATSYQNNVLINATDLVYCILAKQILTIKDGDMTFDASTGTISIAPNIFIFGDTLIAHYNKNS